LVLIPFCCNAGQAESVERAPIPAVEAICPVLDERELRDPRAKGQDTKRFFDDHFDRALPGNGFIDGFYR